MPRRSPDPDRVLDRLRSAVEADDRTATAIAADAGMSQAQLSQITTGRHPNPTLRTLCSLCRALGIGLGGLD